MKKNLNENWLFSKKAKEVISIMPEGWEQVDLPHTWNGKDGQDGGSDFYRGTCYYLKQFNKVDVGVLAATDEVYLEFEGANSSATVYINGKSMGEHDGGYSTWRVNITDAISDENIITVAVDNSSNDRVYPQMADFTFYGGLYRNVSLIKVPAIRFDLDYYGSQAVKVTPKVEGADAIVEVEVYLTKASEKQKLEYTILSDGEIIAIKVVNADIRKVSLEIKDVHLWNGRKDPYLYTCQVKLLDGSDKLDERMVRFGCRTFHVDSQKGFILNGEEYPLHGVSRHQDRPNIGNALLPEHHKEDMDLIMEVGATTIRLAHYQHDQYFYDLCDEKGLVIWAEIPYISQHMVNGRENTISQMKELIVQNYNHPSIVVWGLSNEITMHNADELDMLENHRILNNLVHEMDTTRLSTMAVVTMCETDHEYVHIPDIVSYNHYFGWYGGDTSMNGIWFDEFHKKYPNKPIGLSEYGCEALNWHSSKPEQGDYTEEYQAIYHEELIKQIKERPYLWATHVWNMFDFAADSRSEGGENGMNHKGLVTFDRQYKKDAFYAYKAWLSDEPFVHICGKRYIDRVEDVTKVTVYTNQPEVELYANGKSLGLLKQNKEPFFYYNVPNKGEIKLIAKAGDCVDEGIIRKVNKMNEEYVLHDEGEVINWFEITSPEGYFSVNDKVRDILSCPEGQFLFEKMIKMVSKGKEDTMRLDMNKGIMKLIKGFTVKRILNMTESMGLGKMSKSQILDINAQLNKIAKQK